MEFVILAACTYTGGWLYFCMVRPVLVKAGVIIE